MSETAQSAGANVLAGPKRILVQTSTNLVPGNDYLGRCEFMLDLICRHHWNRPFDPDQDRWHVYGAQFGYDKRRCYFLVDHGQSASDDDVPVLWYQWTGEALERKPQALPLEVQAALNEYPFTRPPIEERPKTAPLNAVARRQSIRTKLRCDMTPSDSDIEFMREHPEEARWLKDHIESRFWLRFESFANSRIEVIDNPSHQPEGTSAEPELRVG